MKLDTLFLNRTTVRRSVLVLAALVCIAAYSSYEAFAHYSGITGVTEKSSSPGCTCHCPSASSATTVTLTTSATTFTTGNSYTFTASVSNSGESAAGIDIAVYSGSLAAISGQGLTLSGGELTHMSPKSLPASWSFTYVARSTPGYDTIYATGNAVNGDGMNDNGTCTDNWNNASKFVIQVVGTGTKTLAVGRTSINLGSLRVGRRVADSVAVRSTGTAALTVTSSAMKSGANFSTFPTSTNRSLAAGSTEIDSVIFQPTGRGAFTDSLIVNTNGDSPSDQRKAIYVTGTGIQAVFGGSTSPLAFGNIRTGRTTHLTYQFANTGDDTLYLQTPSISGAGFTISTMPSKLTLAPTERDSVIVQFAPSAKQAYSGTLTLTATGLTIPTIALSGNGVAPQLSASTSSGLGGIRVGQSLQGNVSVHNSGTDTLHLSAPSLTQSGTKFSLGSYDAAIAPQQNGIFHLSYTPTAERVDSATLTFSSDDPSNATFSVQITASGIAPHMSVVDRDTVNMGQIKVGTSVVRDFGINNTGTDGLNLFSIIASPAAEFTVVSHQSSVGSGSVGYATVKFTAPSVGTFDGMIIVNGDDASDPSDTIFVTGSGINSALSLPASIDFGASIVGTPTQQQLELQNSGGADVKILSYKLLSGSSIFTLADTSTHTVSAGQTSHITVSFLPADAIAYSGSLQITTDDASTPIRTVSLIGRGLKGSISLSTSSLDFGKLDTGLVSSKQIVIRNTGTASAVISGLSITGSNEFAVTAIDPLVTPPFSLAAGDSETVTITFAPRTVGAVSATMSLLQQDNTASTVTLSGEGLAVQGPSGVIQGESLTSSIILSPNPCSLVTQLHISMTHAGTAQIRIYDLSGHDVRSMDLGTLNEGEFAVPLDVSSLASGSYFVQIAMPGGETRASRLVVEH